MQQHHAAATDAAVSVLAARQARWLRQLASLAMVDRCALLVKAVLRGDGQQRPHCKASEGFLVGGLATARAIHHRIVEGSTLPQAQQLFFSGQRNGGM
jgi:hypothetical protein